MAYKYKFEPATQFLGGGTGVVYFKLDSITIKNSRDIHIHYHDFLQLWYCMSGTCSHLVDGKFYTCTRGSFIIVPPFTTHEIYPIEGCEASLVSISAAYSSFAILPEALRAHAMLFFFFRPFPEKVGVEAPLFIQLTGDYECDCTALMNKLFRNGTASSPTPLEIHLFFQSLLSLPPFASDDGACRKALAFCNNKYDGMMRSIDYICNNFRGNIRLADAVRASNICLSDFSALFRKITGMTFSKYVRLLRIIRAFVMIQFSQFSYERIAEECGFKYPNYMFNVFKDYYGYPPGVERAKHDLLVANFPLATRGRDKDD